MQAALAQIVEALRTDEELAKIPGFEAVLEDETDSGLAIERALASTGVMALVSADGFARRTASDECLTGTITFNVDAIENSALNRLEENPGFFTAARTAQAIARRLHRREFPAFASPLMFVRMNRADIAPSTAVMRSVYVAEINIAREPLKNL